jgi:hypothetical protein
MGVYIEGGNTRKVYIKNNTIINNSGGTDYGIYMDAGDSIYIKNNTIDALDLNSAGTGIALYNIVKVLEVDSNTVKNYQNTGIHSRPTTNNLWKVRNNTITNVRDQGMYIEGLGGYFANNTVNGVVAGNGAVIVGNGAEFNSNKLLGVVAGSGIVVNGPNNLVANNYAQAQGVGIAKGISLQANGTGSKIVFNSINVTGTDVVNGRALEVTGGNNYIIKNNIFANNGGGYAAYVSALPAIRDWDYNCYHSTANNFGFLNGSNYAMLNAWGAAIGGDANSKKINPNYESTTSLLPYQKQLNGAGVAAANVLLDIEGELRNQQAPDIGAQEFMVDYGVAQLVSPANECAQTANAKVTVLLRQFGDIPYSNIKIAYQMKN